ncbi:protein KRBA1 isoform X2 [Heterocephalus glaber]|uniref:Protein KRBA1 isoform X2 n=1 Tax=Heterocephalus glaber TaxID=10181 RepID=A0AAX6RKI5_HETGA|nr:protein KRBA1 isoform X2 [Heterocephalus glaber]
MARQVPISFKDLAVRFSEEEWRLLEEGQREFYRDVMRENYEALVSVGTAELLPLSAFLSPTEPRGAAGAGSCTEEGQEPPVGRSPQGGQPQHSLHLTALVQLVKEIPEFLFGELKGTEDSPESGAAILDGDRASLGAVAVGTYPLRGLLSCLPDSPVSRPSLATTPTSSSSFNGPPGDGGQGSPFPIKTVDKSWPTGKEGPGAPNTELNTPTESPGPRKSRQRQERGTVGTGVSPGTSPLQGLINCLTEILVPGPQHPDAALGSVPPLPSLGTSRQTRMDLGPGSLPWPVKTEASSGHCPLQGLLNCLKEIPETQDRRPSPSRAGHPRVQEDPEPWKRNSGGSRRLQTPPHPASPGAGGTLTVLKVEDGCAQSPLVPASCQLSRQGHSPFATRDTRGVRVPGWGPEAQGSAVTMLLSTDPTREPCGPLGPTKPSALRGTPTSFSSGSSTDGVTDFGSPGGSQGQRPGKGCLPGSSPLQGLENCLREISRPRPQPAQPCFSAADRRLRRAEARNWMAYKEGLRGEACEPAHLGQGGREVPTQSPCLAGPQDVPSSCVPACHQEGLKDQGATRPGLWRWPQDGNGVVARPSPLHCLESSLRGILPARPLRFTCLAGPSPGLGPSSSSSLCSSDGEDPRPEPELWQPPLQERGHLPSHKHPVPLSPGPSESPIDSSDSIPGDDPERREPQDCSSLRAGGKAEEEMGGRSLSLRREEGAESACQPGLLSSAAARGGAEPAGPPWPAPPPKKRPRPRATEDPRDLEPGYGRPSVAARTQGRVLSGDPPKLPSNSPPPAAISPAWPAASPQPPCPCGRPLQQELHSLGAALTEKLDQLAAALAGLAQEVATMRTQVDQLGRYPRGPGPKGPASWPWSLPRGPRWAHSPGHRHLPSWRRKGPTRPRPKILRAQVEGCRAGDPQGLSRARVSPVPRLPAGAVLTEPSRPSHSPSQQSPLGPSCPAMLTGHTLLGHPGCHQGPLPPFMPATLPLPQASPTANTDPEPLAAGGTRVGILARPKEPRGALREDLWGGLWKLYLYPWHLGRLAAGGCTGSSAVRALGT